MNMADSTSLTSIKWRSIIGLILIYIAMWFNWQWIWGVLFLIWVIPDVMSGVTYFMEPIEKDRHPILFWTIILSWILMSVFSIGIFFFPEWS